MNFPTHITPILPLENEDTEVQPDALLFQGIIGNDVNILNPPWPFSKEGGNSLNCC